MKKKIIWLLALVPALVAAAIAWNKVRFQYDWDVALARTIFALSEDTVWSVGFSEKKFSSIKIGDSSTRVIQLLGPPLRRDCPNPPLCQWVYSWQRTGTTSFDWRTINFESDQVSAVYRRFFLD